MEKQKTGRGFIVIVVLLILGLIVYYWIKNNWVNINECYFDDCGLSVNDEFVVDDVYEVGSYSFVLEDFSGNLTVGEYTDLKIRVIKDGETFKDFTGMAILWMMDESGNVVEPDDWTNDGFYEFELEDQGKKTFVNGLKIDQTGKYLLVVESLFDEGCSGSFDIVVHDK